MVKPLAEEHSYRCAVGHPVVIDDAHVEGSAALQNEGSKRAEGGTLRAMTFKRVVHLPRDEVIKGAPRDELDGLLGDILIEAMPIAPSLDADMPQLKSREGAGPGRGKRSAVGCAQ